MESRHRLLVSAITDHLICPIEAPRFQSKRCRTLVCSAQVQVQNRHTNKLRPRSVVSCRGGIDRSHGKCARLRFQSGSSSRWILRYKEVALHSPHNGSKFRAAWRVAYYDGVKLPGYNCEVFSLQPKFNT